ncbi:MAG: hypothetical protein HY928_16870 [Elusimicrobia bacterium]|nr:hypothetical protein [Elusimicrobiota bacterium]
MTANYAFSHMAFRGLAFEKPLVALGLIAMPVGREEFARVWNRIVEKEGGEPRVVPDDFSGEVRPLPEGGDLGILGVPRASEMAEALLVGVHVKPGPRRLLVVESPPLVRYFTLEVTMSLDGGPPSNVLCEWTHDGDGFGHANYGLKADPPGPEGFAAAVGRVLRGDL